MSQGEATLWIKSLCMSFPQERKNPQPIRIETDPERLPASRYVSHLTQPSPILHRQHSNITPQLNRTFPLLATHLHLDIPTIIIIINPPPPQARNRSSMDILRTREAICLIRERHEVMLAIARTARCWLSEIGLRSDRRGLGSFRPRPAITGTGTGAGVEGFAIFGAAC